jgi:hypothetical protein
MSRVPSVFLGSIGRRSALAIGGLFSSCEDSRLHGQAQSEQQTVNASGRDTANGRLVFPVPCMDRYLRPRKGKTVWPLSFGGSQFFEAVE